MKAGRELDALVAERVMELHVWTEEEIHRASHWLVKGQYVIDVRQSANCTTVVPVPYYSTSIADAWLVVEKAEYYEASGHDGSYRWYLEINGKYGEADAPTPALAICLAALQSVGDEAET